MKVSKQELAAIEAFENEDDEIEIKSFKNSVNRLLETKEVIKKEPNDNQIYHPKAYK